MKSFFFKLILIFQIIFLFPVILLIILVWPLFKIKIGAVKSKSVGSIALLEIFLCDKKAGIYKKREIFLWYHHREVANKYLLNKRRENLIFLPGFILYPIRLFFHKFRFTHKHIYYQTKYDHKKNIFITTHEKLRTDQRLLKKYSPFVKFSPIEIKKGENYLEKNFIKKTDKIILFGVRTAIYRNENYISVRNSNIRKQIKSMKFVSENGFKAIRMGRDKINKLGINSKKIFDYTFSKSQTEFLDVFITSRAKFMVSGNTGLNELATMMRVPKLIVDFSNFNFLKVFNEEYTPIILPKKVFCQTLNRNLSYKEIFEKRISDINTIDQLPEDCQLIDNTEDEILEASKEMIKLVIHKNLNLNYEYKKQIYFWKTFSKFYEPNSKIVISPSFFEKYNDLFI